jgi:hypothetical protein
MEAAPNPFSRNNREAFSMITSFLVLFLLLWIFAMLPTKIENTNEC